MTATIRHDEANNNHESDYKKCDWKSIANAVESLLDDGHRPEVLLEGRREVLRIYPEYHIDRSVHVHVVDNAVPETLVDALYDFTVQYCKEKPAWGSYVTLDQIKKHGLPTDDFVGCSLEELSINAATYFFRNSMVTDPISNEIHVTKSISQHKLIHNLEPKISSSVWTESDMLNPNVHGVALWALASDVGSSVPYHIDYAELVRYEYGYLIPPILSGTLHCTKHTIVGGEYCVSTDGLDHYLKYGYKGLLFDPTDKSSLSEKANTRDRGETKTLDSCGNDGRKVNSNESKLFVDEKVLMSNDDSWIRIPYRYNRMICQSGHLPHLSTPVQSIGTSVTAKETNNDARRVIIGFNVFLRDVGPCIQQAPEHSDAFRKRVSDLRRRKHQQLRATNFSFVTVKANPKLSKLLVRAKREIVKRSFKTAQEALDQQIADYIIEQKCFHNCDMQYLENHVINRFSATDGTWPNSDDVQVHFRHRFNRIQELHLRSKQCIVEQEEVQNNSL